MKTLPNQNVLIVSISDLDLIIQRKHKDGKIDLKNLTPKSFDYHIQRQIKLSDITILTFGTEKIIIKSKNF